MDRRSALVVFCCLSLLSACGQVEELRSARLQQATDLNQRAQHAFQRGEYQVAEALYGNALQLDVAIENVDGIAINTLNLARTNQAMGKYAVAQRYLDSLLADKALHYAPARLAAAAVQKSLLLLQDDDVPGATQWLGKATGYCATDCRIAGVIDNARAGIALRSGAADDALHWSEHAASENRGSSQLEYANSLRLQASARMLKKDHDAALNLLEEALDIDKSLGLPEKIRQDLLLSARAYEALGQTGLAMQFRDRASRIAAATAK